MTWMATVWSLLLSAQNPTFEIRSWTTQGNPQVMYESRLDQGLVRSQDGGRTWQKASSGLPRSIGAAEVSPVVALAQGRAPSEILYCATEVDGVFRSEDGGDTWILASSGLPVPLRHATRGPLLSVDSTNSEIVYTLMTVPVHSHLQATMLYRSRDAGRHWSLLKEFPEDGHFDALSVEAPGLLRLTGVRESVEIRDDYAELQPDATPITPGVLLLPRLRKTDVSALDRDQDGVAILYDDGTLLARRFGLSGMGFQYRPNGAGGYDVGPVAPNLQTNLDNSLTLTDEGFQSVPLPFTFRFYGRDYTSVYINANGNVTFGAISTSSVESSVALFSGPPRIAPLWDDLNPQAGGGVFTGSTPQSFTVTWSQIPEFLTTNSNTFQLTLWADGVIEVQFGSVQIQDGLTGISNGGVTDGHFAVFDSNLNLTDLGPAPIHEIFSTTPLNATAITRRFYQQHEDEFDALFVFGASELPVNLAGPSATAFYAGVRNDVRGIGTSPFDITATYGSGGRLQGYLNMNSLAYYPANVNMRIGTGNDSALTLFGQEWGHRFLAYSRFRNGGSTSSALLGRSNSHWNYFFNSDASVMEGNQWLMNNDGTFTNVDNTQRYSLLDQYNMGLRDAAEVPPLLLIENPEPVASGTIGAIESTFSRTTNAIRDSARDFGRSSYYNFLLGVEGTTATTQVTSSGQTQFGLDPNVVNTGVNIVTTLGAAVGKGYWLTKSPSSSPQSRYYDGFAGGYFGENIVFRGAGRTLSVTDIIAQEGQRIPGVSHSQKQFRHAFVLVVPRGSEATPADIAEMGGMRRAWETFYSQATDGTSSTTTSLDRQNVNDIFHAIGQNGIFVYTGKSPSASVTVGPAIVDAGADPVAGVAIIASRNGSNIVSETAITAGSALLEARFYVETGGGVNTGFAATAPAAASMLVLELNDAAGAPLATQQVFLSSGGHFAGFLTEIFQNIPIPFVGSVTVKASAPVVLTALRTILNEADDFLMTTLPVTDLNAARVTAAQYISQVAEGGGYSVEIQLMNTGASTLTGTVEFYASPNGNPLSLAVDGATRSSLPYSLSPHGVRVLRTDGAGALRTGYVIIRPDPGQFAPSASSVILFRAGGLLVGATGVSATAVTQRLRIYFDRTLTHDTGVAIVNASSGVANLQMTYRTSAGSIIPGGTQTLPAGGHNARFVSEIGPVPPPVGNRGTLEVVSDAPIAAVALRTTQSGNRYLLSSLPIIDLDRGLTPGPLYFAQRAHGGGYTTEYVLINAAGSIVPVRLSLVIP